MRAITVYAGSGNNAGDGYVLAGHARQRGFAVELKQIGRTESLGADARRALEFALGAGVVLEPLNDAPPRGDVLVDALLGTGARGAMRDSFQAAIDHLNAADRLVVALDLPSGVDADTGGLLTKRPVVADLTVTFIAPKLGLTTGPATDCVGELVVDRLEAPRGLYDSHPAPGIAVLDGRLRHALERPINAHKGLFGRLAVVGGDAAMGGAVALTATAALNIGAGIVRVATHDAHRAVILTRAPEAMVQAVEDDAALDGVLAASTSFALGPGLGRTPWGETLARRVLEHCTAEDKPVVIDADGLNFIAARQPAIPPRAVLTPHPGEAARLLDSDNATIQNDRSATVRSLSERYAPAVVVLKGAGTLLAADGELVGICRAGNPVLAIPGSGDVLTGLIGGLLSRGLPPRDAAALGVWLHADAGDRALQSGSTLVASAIVSFLATRAQ